MRSAVEQTAFCHNRTLAAAMTTGVLYSTCRYLCALHQCPSPLIHVFTEQNVIELYSTIELYARMQHCYSIAALRACNWLQLWECAKCVSSMYVNVMCRCVNVCQNIFDSIHVHFNHLCSFLPMKCVHKCVDELHKISCNSYCILITQQWLEGASISSWGGSPTSF